MKYLFICFVVLLVTSCKYHCDGYDTEQTAALAFRLGDTIQYQSNKLDTITLIVDDFYAEGASSHSAVMVMDYECPVNAYYTTITEEKYGISIKELDTQHSSRYEEQILFCNSDVYEIASWKKDNESENLDSLLVGNKIYRNVRVVKDLTGNRRISNFVKAPYHGIIKFYDSHKNLTWEQVKIVKKDNKSPNFSVRGF